MICLPFIDAFSLQTHNPHGIINKLHYYSLTPDALRILLVLILLEGIERNDGDKSEEVLSGPEPQTLGRLKIPRRGLSSCHFIGDPK